MSKRNKVIYWIATVWLGLAMTSSGIVQLLQVQAEVDFILKLGYPAYFISFLGFWKLLGVVALFLPRTPLLKEWTYAAFFFSMLCAAYSHVAVGNGFKDIFPPVLVIILTITSWYFRPASKKTSANI